jgi:hypothetical protein
MHALADVHHVITEYNVIYDSLANSLSSEQVASMFEPLRYLKVTIFNLRARITHSSNHDGCASYTVR